MPGKADLSLPPLRWAGKRRNLDESLRAGLGASGGLFAARLAGAGHEVSALARGATLAAVRERGLGLTSIDHAFAETVSRTSPGAVLWQVRWLQDAEAGRVLEVDALIGAVREIGQHVGVATPNVDALLGLGAPDGPDARLDGKRVTDLSRPRRAPQCPALREGPRLVYSSAQEQH